MEPPRPGNTLKRTKGSDDNPLPAIITIGQIAWAATGWANSRFALIERAYEMRPTFHEGSA